MKYVVTKTQLKNNFEYLKEPMFRYWDSRGPKDLKIVRNLFGIPPGGSTLVQDWLLEWYGGAEELAKNLDKYTHRVMRAVAGTYDFKFYLTTIRIYAHDGVEIYFDTVVDGDGHVSIEHDGSVIDNIYDANKLEDIGWEVDTEIRDTIKETIDEIIDIEFNINIDSINITEPEKFDT